MAAPSVFALSQVSPHNSKHDCWLVVNGKVLDVTKFLEDHPGGESALLEVAGKDATKEYEAIGHSKAASEVLLMYQVGILHGFSLSNGDATLKSESREEEREGEGNTMKGFVIKDEVAPRSFTLVEFLLPLVIACAVFWYRYSCAIAGVKS